VLDLDILRCGPVAPPPHARARRTSTCTTRRAVLPAEHRVQAKRPACSGEWIRSQDAFDGEPGAWILDYETE
jgi:hypothetical protein